MTEKLTMQEVIYHCEETIQQIEYMHKSLYNDDSYEHIVSNRYWEHRQVAEWLRKLQSYEDLGFTPTYDINNFIKLLKNVLLILDPESKNVITNFAKYKNLLFISAKYMELSLLEKQNFLVELLFNIFQYDFNDEEINTIINQKLNVYDYCYSLNVL